MNTLLNNSDLFVTGFRNTLILFFISAIFALVAATGVAWPEQMLGLLITEAHDRAAHFALGYESWDDYVRAEFKMSPSRSYQLLDTGHVMRAMATSGVDIDHMSPPPTRVVTRVKDRLADVRKATRDAIKNGEDPIKALRLMAAEPRIPKARIPTGDAPPSPEAPEPEVEVKDVTSVNLITCPACDGDGKVTRGLANKLRPFMKKLTVSITTAK